MSKNATHGAFTLAQLNRAKNKILQSIPEEGIDYASLYEEFSTAPDKDGLFEEAVEQLGDRLRFTSLDAVGKLMVSRGENGAIEKAPVNVMVFRTENFETGLGALLGKDHPKIKDILAGTHRPQATR